VFCFSNSNYAAIIEMMRFVLIDLNVMDCRNTLGSLQLILVVGQLMFKKAYRYFDNDLLKT